MSSSLDAAQRNRTTTTAEVVHGRIPKAGVGSSKSARGHTTTLSSGPVLSAVALAHQGALGSAAIRRTSYVGVALRCRTTGAPAVVPDHVTGDDHEDDTQRDHDHGRYEPNERQS